MEFSKLNRRRIDNFKRNKRGYYSFWLFSFLFIISLFADFIANEKPLLIKYESNYYYPIFSFYAETTFSGDFETEADYKDPYVKQLINEKGWMIWPPIRFSYDTINYDLPTPAPSRPTTDNILGTDDQGRDD